MIQLILAFFTALPELMKLVKYFESKFGPNWSDQIQQIGEAYVELDRAKSQEERDAAARALLKSWNG